MSDFEKQLVAQQHQILDTEFDLILQKFPQVSEHFGEEVESFLLSGLAEKSRAIEKFYGLIHEQNVLACQQVSDLEAFAKLQEKQYLEFLSQKQEVNAIRHEMHTKRNQQAMQEMQDEQTAKVPALKCLFDSAHLNVHGSGFGQLGSMRERIILFITKQTQQQELRANATAAQQEVHNRFLLPQKKNKLEVLEKSQQRIQDLMRVREQYEKQRNLFEPWLEEEAETRREQPCENHLEKYLHDKIQQKGAVLGLDDISYSFESYDSDSASSEEPEERDEPKKRDEPDKRENSPIREPPGAGTARDAELGERAKPELL